MNSTSTLSHVIMNIVACFEKSSVDRAKIISELLKNKTFRVIYKKVNRDENNEIVMREAFCTLDFESLLTYSNSYREYTNKSTENKKSKRKAYESSCISYYDLEKDAFRCFKMQNLVEIEMLEFNEAIKRVNQI